MKYFKVCLLGKMSGAEEFLARSEYVIVVDS